MEKLHPDIVENILCRLPIEKALQAKRICTTWGALLRCKTADEVRLLFSFSYPQVDEKKNKVYISEIFSCIDEAIDSFVKTKGSNYDSMLRSSGLLRSSGGGLLCCESKSKHYRSEPFLICKNLTGEVAHVREPINYCRKQELHMSGFGYCHSTNEYKLVRMYFGSDEPKREQKKPLEQYHVQVYTVGTGEWRNKGSTINFQKRTKKEDINISPLYSTGIYANGAIHWLHKRETHLDYEDYTVSAFDLEDENFQFIPLPYLKDGCKHRVKLLGGNNLYFVDTICGTHCTDIWAYKRNNTNTTDDACDMNGSNEKKKKLNYNDKNSWHWIKEFSIEWEERYLDKLQSFDFLAITRNNELLLRYDDNLYSYGLKTSTLNKLFDGFLMCCSMINALLTLTASFQCR